MSRAKSQKSATTRDPDVNAIGVREFRDHLSAYLERVKSGESLTITEHGKPIARIIGQARSPWAMELIARGELTPARQSMPDLTKFKRVKISGSTQDLIDEIR